MRLYSIFVYVLIFNLVLGFIATTINGVDGEEGIFLPDAKGVVTLQTVESLNTAQDQLEQSLNKTMKDFQAGDILGTMGSIGHSILDMINVGITFLGSLFMTLPTLICNVAGIQIPDALMKILTIGMVILTVFTFIQLITGKWFSFVE